MRPGGGNPEKNQSPYVSGARLGEPHMKIVGDAKSYLSPGFRRLRHNSRGEIGKLTDLQMGCGR